MISLGKLSSFTLISTELPLIFSAGSRDFNRKRKHSKSTASASSPQTYGRHAFPGENWRKFLIFLIQVVKILIICNFSSWEVAWAQNNIKKLGSGSRSGSGSGHKAVIDWGVGSQKSSVKCQTNFVISLCKLSSFTLIPTENVKMFRCFHYANLVHLHCFQQSFL